MSVPTAGSYILSRQLSEGPSLPSDASSNGVSSFGPAISATTHDPTSHGIKRKASEMDSADPASRTCPPIKQEPGSPDPFDYKRNSTIEAHPELYESTTRCTSHSISDDREDQTVSIRGNEGTLKMGPSNTSLPFGGRLNTSSQDMPVTIKPGAEACTARIAVLKKGGEANGLLRPSPILDTFPPRGQQKGSSRSGDLPRRNNGKKFDDVAYESIPDYSPPLSTLPEGSSHNLQVLWRPGVVIDLSKDPDRHMLHEAERRVAATLQLSCAKYLCTKRRIFQARFEALLAGREFKKSAASKACKIDVNRTSKLCNAFERIGWFDEKYLLKHLDENKLKKANKEDNNSGSHASKITERGIWDVSESGSNLSSSGDEESTDDETANSSVSPDSKYDNSEGPTHFDSHHEDSSRKDHFERLLTRGNGSQRIVPNDRTGHIRDTVSASKIIDEGTGTGGRKPEEQIISIGNANPRNADSLSGGGFEELPPLETRSRTRKIKLALNGRLGDDPDNVSIIEAKEKGDNPQGSAPGEMPHKLLLAAEAEIQENFEREKADIIAELDCNFELEKWALVAEAMSRNGSANYPADLIRAQYELLTGNPQRADAKNEEKENTCAHLRRRPTYTVLDGKTETSIPSRSEVGRIDQASIATNLPQSQHPQRTDSKSQTTAIIRGKKSVDRSYKCEKCGKKYRSQASLIYHQEFHLNCISARPGSHKRTKRNLDSYSDAGHEEPRSDRQDPHANAPNPRLSFPNSTPRNNPTAQLQVNRIEDAPADEDSPSARMRRIWAIRRALGTNGRSGGPPKARGTAKKLEVSLAPTVTYQNGHSPALSPSHVPPNTMEKDVRHDTNPEKQCLEQIMPATSQIVIGQKDIITPPPKEVGMQRHRSGAAADQTQYGAKRQTCKKCGMGYVDRANHYHVYPKIGSEHRRRMAANKAAAACNLGPNITDVGVESTSDISMGQVDI